MGKFLFILSSAFLLASQALSQGIIESSLEKSMRFGDRKNVVVSMNTGTEEVLERINGQTFSDDAEKRTAMVGALKANRDVSQAGVLNFLNKQGPMNFESSWISNEVFIKNANPFLIQSIANIPGVSNIREERVFQIDPIYEMNSITYSNNMTRQRNRAWGIEKIQCSTAWRNGKGRGVKVGIIDTGVRQNHEAIRSQYVGARENGWFDPYSKSATPNDENGHGTHCTGTILGNNNIGVAPEAKWLACKGCNSRSCTNSALASCGQFMLCPTDPQGRNSDCKKAPNVVSNSWGGGPSGSDYDRIINAWISGGIVPVFSQGNSGPNCETAGYPGNNKNVIGVGSTDTNDAISNFSSKGPSTNSNSRGENKPDVSAPGHDVYSAWNNADNGYRTISGTSMACPHISGVAALIIEQKPGIKVADVRNIIRRSVDTSVRKSGRTCGGKSEDQFPNNTFGHGRINAAKASQNARS